MGAAVRALLLLALVAAGAEALSLDVHHRYSATVRRWAGLRTGPAPGTAEYYAALAGHDDLRRRSLSLAAAAAAPVPGAGGPLAFADGNDTYRLNAFGFPRKSSTSRMVPCSSDLCDLQTQCSAATNSCPYKIEYLSDNTSSNGVLVEDVLYLATESGKSKITQAPITFGCGRVQTGSFLGSAAPNGLLGLGMDSKSVPSLLASQGVAANSFSMCFGEDGHGRINFGDTGSADQLETPLNIYKHNPYYNISIIGAKAGGKTFSTKFSAVVDSGTSFTALSDPMYTEITSAFHKQVKEKRNQADSSLPFEYCYTISAKGALSHPNISLTAKGGSIFPVNDPIITITDISSTPVGYCLAIMKSEGVNLIGENFMSGLKVVFDRERLVLGWKSFNCYSVDHSSKLPVSPNPSAVPPKPASGPGSSNPEAAKRPSPNITQIDAAKPSSGSSIHLHFSRTFLFAAIAPLFLAIL
ncbi:aspartyl protease family protein 1-like isoform X2 [Triticum dicoccoides]|uniref:aspartyl protease family protein 1-like isoform X2 n=1 Tax=Triticum dicoccoides TaxID=85692 RepID=UPI00188F2780|nr:aspartyl protease family protein 1-like isoform X2 [Triticum dicoccoides]